MRQTGAGAVGGGGACAAIASRGRRRRDGWSRPFPCAPSRRTAGRRHCRGPKFVVDRCVLEPMPAARAHAVRARAVHPRAGRVVHLCSVRPDRATSARQRRRHRGGAPARALCWRCACLRCRACVHHARVACTCCACACCACLRYARLRFPCSRCVHLLCLPLLCVPALCAFVRCVVCLCSAHLHRVELADPASPSTLATCHDLYPFPILSHICLLLSCHHALFLPLCPISCLCCPFFLFHILLHTLSCSCLRLCLRKVAQVSLSAAEHPGHLISHTFPPLLLPLCLLCFPAALLSFLLQQRKRGGRVLVPPFICSALLLRFLCVCISAI